MTERTNDSLHVDLCAFLLGELDPTRDAARIAAVESALADDPELREERTRLEAVLGTVENAFSADDELSAEIRGSLLAEAEHQAARRASTHPITAPSPPSWWGVSSVAVAAGLLVAVSVKLAGLGIDASEPVADVAAGRKVMSSSIRHDRAQAEPLAGEDPAHRERAAAIAEGKVALGPIDLFGAAPPVEPVMEITEALAKVDPAFVPVPAPPADSISTESIPTESIPTESIMVAGAELVLDQTAVAPTQFGKALSVGYGLERDARESAESASLLALTTTKPESGELPALRERVLRVYEEKTRGGRLDTGARVFHTTLGANVESTTIAIPQTRSATTAAPTTPTTPAPLSAGLRARFYLDADGDYDVEVAPAVTAEQIVRSCRPRPNEPPSMMYFRFWGDNAFELAMLDAMSTFAADVDTASYALARRYLNEGMVPEKAQIRTEEFVNYFTPDVAPPAEGTFKVDLELAESIFGGEDSGRWLLRVAVRGKEIPRAERQPQRLTFVVDTSGSMKKENRLELVKHALRLLVHQLDGRDAISLVTFSTESSLALPMTSATDKATIEAAIHALTADGNTNAEAGLKLGYGHLAEHLDAESVHRVVLLSDGVANVGQTDHDRISAEVATYREKGIYLNTVGVGLGNHNDVLLEQLADKGDGICSYVDSAEEAKRALVDRFVGAFQPIARDVKIQVEFDPNQVKRYRLLGYENRAVADSDFRNDAVDAGELGSGHQVCALYEIEPLLSLPSEDADGDKLATARVRWLPPHGHGDEASEIDASIGASDSCGGFAKASPGYRRSALVAQFAELLRRSTHAQGDSLDRLTTEVALLDKELGDPEFTEFCELVGKSRALIVAQLPKSDPLTQAIDAVRKNSVLKAELEALAKAEDSELIDAINKENARLEKKLKELLEKRLSK